MPELDQPDVTQHVYHEQSACAQASMGASCGWARFEFGLGTEANIPLLFSL